MIESADRAADTAPTVTPRPASPARSGPLRWFLHPYVQILLGALLNTAAEVMLKRGADAAPEGGAVASLFGITALASHWTWFGIVCYVLSFVSWLYVLRLLPLSIAFPLINVVHILVPAGAWIFLHETISFTRWLGIAAILAGILLIVRPVARAEEKL